MEVIRSNSEVLYKLGNESCDQSINDTLWSTWGERVHWCSE